MLFSKMYLHGPTSYTLFIKIVWGAVLKALTIYP